MLEKSCAKSHGQPVPGVRNAAMMARRRSMSREGVITRIPALSMIRKSGGRFSEKIMLYQNTLLLPRRNRSRRIAISFRRLPAYVSARAGDHADLGLHSIRRFLGRSRRRAVRLGRYGRDRRFLALSRYFHRRCRGLVGVARPRPAARAHASRRQAAAAW